VVEALLRAVADGAVGEKTGKAPAHGGEQLRLAGDVQERVLLAGEAGVGEVLGGGAAAHGDVHVVGVVAPGEGAIGLDDRPVQLRRELRAENGAPDAGAGAAQRLRVAAPAGQALRDALGQPVRIEERAVGLGGDGEALRNPDSLGLEVLDHSPSEAFLPPTVATSPESTSSYQRM
jgi:hypothetical protein